MRGLATAGRDTFESELASGSSVERHQLQDSMIAHGWFAGHARTLAVSSPSLIWILAWVTRAWLPVTSTSHPILARWPRRRLLGASYGHRNQPTASSGAGWRPDPEPAPPARRAHRSVPSGQADHRAKRISRDRESTVAGTPRRYPHPKHPQRPIAHAHPTQHSYAESSLGPPTSCGSTGQDLNPVGNPRSHCERAPAPRH